MADPVMSESGHGFAVPTDGVLVLDVQVSPEGVICLKVPCGDYDVFKKLPKAVTHGGRTFGLTGWDSDMCLACYRSDAQIARPA